MSTRHDRNDGRGADIRRKLHRNGYDPARHSMGTDMGTMRRRRGSLAGS